MQEDKTYHIKKKIEQMNEGIESVDKLINERIDRHIEEHEGLYSLEDIEKLRPLWVSMLHEEVVEFLKNKQIIMTSQDYYVAPSQEVFEDIKKHSIALWKTFDDTYGYSTGKIEIIKEMTNIEDNAGYMLAMFDSHNQATLLEMVELDETKEKLISLKHMA